MPRRLARDIAILRTGARAELEPERAEAWRERPYEPGGGEPRDYIRLQTRGKRRRRDQARRIVRMSRTAPYRVLSASENGCWARARRGRDWVCVRLAWLGAVGTIRTPPDELAHHVLDSEESRELSLVRTKGRAACYRKGDEMRAQAYSTARAAPLLVHGGADFGLCVVRSCTSGRCGRFPTRILRTSPSLQHFLCLDYFLSNPSRRGGMGSFLVIPIREDRPPGLSWVELLSVAGDAAVMAQLRPHVFFKASFVVFRISFLHLQIRIAAHIY
ncbi:hypothetical protein C8R45DRAFT_1158643 [Mycena sanguinolenta]|nr:hypothetical protein C8R45DRAFT_1158643 [Mycena sanguinolenta]